MEGWSSRRCALTWKLVGTPFNRLYFQLQVSALPTEETASGLLLTPTTREEVMDTDKFKERMEKYDNGTTVPNLATQVVGLLPTPKATEISETWEQHEERAKKPSAKNRGASLSATVNGMLPTPRTADVEGGAVSNVKNDGKGWYRENAKGERWGVKLRDVAELGTTSQLSPLFVEEMMGFPKNWTASPFQSGEENQSKPTGTP